VPDSVPDASPPLSLSMETSARAAAQQGDDAVDDALSAVDTKDVWVCSLGGQLDAGSRGSRGLAEKLKLLLLDDAAAVKESVAASSSASHDGRMVSAPVEVGEGAVS